MAQRGYIVEAILWKIRAIYSAFFRNINWHHFPSFKKKIMDQRTSLARCKYLVRRCYCTGSLVSEFGATRFVWWKTRLSSNLNSGSQAKTHKKLSTRWRDWDCEARIVGWRSWGASSTLFLTCRCNLCYLSYKWFGYSGVFLFASFFLKLFVFSMDPKLSSCRHSMIISDVFMYAEQAWTARHDRAAWPTRHFKMFVALVRTNPCAKVTRTSSYSP